MPLLRTRPRVSLRLPRTVLPGSSFVAELTLDASRPIPINAIDMSLTGVERSRIGDGNQAIRSMRQLIHLKARVSGERTLPAGKTEWRSRFELPASLPPTYEGGRAGIEYSLLAHIDIPWWPDRTAQFVVVVAAPALPAPASEGVRFSSRPAGPLAREAHVECSLASPYLAPGGVLEGSVALSNVAHNRYQGVSVALVGSETLQTEDRKYQRRAEAVRYSIDVAAPQPFEEMRAYPFQMRVPAGLPHSRKAVLFELAWYVEVRAKLAWARDLLVDIPVTVFPGASRSDVRRLAPSVGADRLQAVWSAVADAAALHLEDMTLSGKVGEADLAIRREHRGRQGIFLVAEVAVPSLGLGLQGGSRHALTELWSRGVELEDDAWDRRNRIVGRDRKQVQAFLVPLRTALSRFDIDRLDDRCIRVQRKEPGLTLGPLQTFVREAIELAKTLAPAREAIPVPDSMARAEPSWVALARRLEGRLEKGDMSITGKLDQVDVEVVTEWEQGGAPSCTSLRVSASEPVRESFHVRWQRGEPASGVRTPLPVPARELFDSAVEGALSLAIDAGGIELVLPAPLEDGAVVLARVRTLCDLLAAFRLAGGPYR